MRKLVFPILLGTTVLVGCGSQSTAPAPETTSTTATSTSTTASSATTSTTSTPTATEEPGAAEVLNVAPEPVTPVAPAAPAAGRLPTSGEIQGCWFGVIDPDTCASLGTEYRPPEVATPQPVVEYPTLPDGTVDEGAITENFWNCMAAGGTEESCRQ